MSKIFKLKIQLLLVFFLVLMNFTLDWKESTNDKEYSFICDINECRFCERSYKLSSCNVMQRAPTLSAQQELLEKGWYYYCLEEKIVTTVNYRLEDNATLQATYESEAYKAIQIDNAIVHNTKTNEKCTKWVLARNDNYVN